MFDNMFNEYQIKSLLPKYNELVICNMYFPRIPITLNGVVIKMPEHITFECRKSDTLWMLVSAGLSMGLSLISPNDVDVDVDHVINVINNYLKTLLAILGGWSQLLIMILCELAHAW
jgi:hypothetical protein